ncbi:MAG TPA: hypothetical protein VHF69_05490, partial [Candidatus Synoicihabitans sp.]|nr:hypothetical protein [Candidatus Synoicihabitans sp.]
MATKTFEQLKLALASLWGFEAVEDLLAQDVADIESYINAAYFDCFAPVDGSRPNYSERYFSKILKAPVVATIGLTQGSTVVTGHEFDGDFAGSFVKIGDSYLRYSGSVTTSGDTPVTTYHLLQPWQGATGS